MSEKPARFTIDHARICFEHAACLRQSYLRRDGEKVDEYADQYSEAELFDQLGNLIEDELQCEVRGFNCAACGDGQQPGSGIKYGSVCLACMGSGEIPPKQKSEE